MENYASQSSLNQESMQRANKLLTGKTRLEKKYFDRLSLVMAPHCYYLSGGSNFYARRTGFTILLYEYQTIFHQLMKDIGKKVCTLGDDYLILFKDLMEPFSQTSPNRYYQIEQFDNDPKVFLVSLYIPKEVANQLARRRKSTSTS